MRNCPAFQKAEKTTMTQKRDRLRDDALVFLKYMQKHHIGKVNAIKEPTLARDYFIIEVMGMKPGGVFPSNTSNALKVSFPNLCRKIRAYCQYLRENGIACIMFGDEGLYIPATLEEGWNGLKPMRSKAMSMIVQYNKMKRMLRQIFNPDLFIEQKLF